MAALTLFTAQPRAPANPGLVNSRERPQIMLLTLAEDPETKGALDPMPGSWAARPGSLRVCMEGGMEAGI